MQREFGRPALVDRVTSWNGPIMTYRWNDGSDMFYFVYFVYLVYLVYLDDRDIVRRAHPGMEFINAPDRD